jgi:hypothetical protein
MVVEICDSFVVGKCQTMASAPKTDDNKQEAAQAASRKNFIDSWVGGYLMQAQQEFHTGGCEIFQNPSSPKRKRNGKSFHFKQKKPHQKCSPFALLVHWHRHFWYRFD